MFDAFSLKIRAEETMRQIKVLEGSAQPVDAHEVIGNALKSILETQIAIINKIDEMKMTDMFTGGTLG